jgi:hypothetical protein
MKLGSAIPDQIERRTLPHAVRIPCHSAWVGGLELAEIAIPGSGYECLLQALS